MASTPPAGGNIHTPPTPLHGTFYDSYEPYSPRYRTRASHRGSRATPEPVDNAESRTSRSRKSTPPPKSSSTRNLNSTLSPPHTTRPSPKQKHKSRVFPASPTSPNTESMEEPTPIGLLAPEPSDAPSRTIMRGGMLPTPVKTPRKKHIANVETAGRALFQDQPLDLDDVAAVPRRSKKNRRHNGFSLESFCVDDDGNTSNEIQIFTDSRDKIPEVDHDSENPFYDLRRGKGTSAKKVSGKSKRRKVSGEDNKDRDVEEAFQKNEGMVYVCRGKKQYRKFESDDEDEEIEPNDVGLLAHADGVIDPSKPHRTLTRKSIKPTRLFQSEIQKRDLEAEKEEEAPTEIEDNSDEGAEVVDLINPKYESEFAKSTKSAAPPKQHMRSTITNAHFESDSDASQGASNSKPKKRSPFDTWKRVKKGSVAEPATASKGKKRASETVEDESSKKLKA